MKNLKNIPESTLDCSIASGMRLGSSLNSRSSESSSSSNRSSGVKKSFSWPRISTTIPYTTGKVIPTELSWRLNMSHTKKIPAQKEDPHCHWKNEVLYLPMLEKTRIIWSWLTLWHNQLKAASETTQEQHHGHRVPHKGSKWKPLCPALRTDDSQTGA